MVYLYLPFVFGWFILVTIDNDGKLLTTTTYYFECNRYTTIPPFVIVHKVGQFPGNTMKFIRYYLYAVPGPQCLYYNTSASHMEKSTEG